MSMWNLTYFLESTFKGDLRDVFFFNSSYPEEDANGSNFIGLQEA